MRNKARFQAAPRLAVLVAAALLAACARGPAVVLHGSGGEPVRVAVEVVNDPASRATGLMYRRELAPKAGMLFVFPDDAPRQFWMKNTFIPLDMIFIDRTRKVVGVVANARPLTTEGRGVEGASRYVLEVNAGFAREYGIAPGTRVEFERVSDAAR